MADSTRYRQIARHYAKAYGIDPNVFERQINLESGFNKFAKSPAGAQGIAQFMPGTAQSEGVKPYNVHSALKGAARLDAKLVNQTGSLRKALAAYNAGPGNIPAGLGYADKILAGQNPKPTTRATPKTQAITTTTPGVDHSADRLSVLRDYLLNLSPHDTQGTALVGALGQIQSLKDTPAQTITKSVPGGSGLGGKAASYFGQIVQQANKINAAHVPYQWGGGHAAKQSANASVTPLDCSGTVSRVLGVNPRVAAQFENWGKPGRGQKVTIYANGTHTFLEINGHFFGTSRSNPGGGPGWIPRAAMPKAYLKNFVARHPAGL